nr:hypothetical protein [Clostridia bacterium]
MAGSIDITALCNNTEKCLCWLIILLDIFAIFYLVFVSFYKVTEFAKMLGWICIGVLITADVIIVAIHPCILTLLCILFTIMIMAAILSVVLPGAGVSATVEQSGGAQRPKNNTKCGSYVIREIDSKKYCFEIYDKQDRFLVRSCNCYKSVADVKYAISVSRESGIIADVEDRTASWIKEVNHPKFEMFKEGDGYCFRLSLDGKSVIFKSQAYQTLQECKKQLDKTIVAVASTAVYISVEKLSGADAAQYKNMKSTGFENEVAATLAQPTAEVPAEPATGDGAIVINTEEKKTLWESYAELPAKQKAFFDGLRKAAKEKADTREFEASSQLSFVLFKNNLLRIRIRRNAVEAVFMLMDATFKRLDVAGNVKIKETKTVLRIEDDTYYALALETLDKKYNLLLEQKNERESQKKAERQEKAKQKRLSQKKHK